MKNCVILASHIPSNNLLYIGKDILDRIKKNLPDADIVVGINPSPVQDEWISIIKEYTDNYAVTPDHLIIPSDASAYQTGLRLYAGINKSYNYVWFLHTQGTKSGLHKFRIQHLNTLLNVENIINMFNHPIIGAMFILRGHVLNEILDKTTNDLLSSPLYVWPEQKNKNVGGMSGFLNETLLLLCINLVMWLDLKLTLIGIN